MYKKAQGRQTEIKTRSRRRAMNKASIYSPTENYYCIYYSQSSKHEV